MTPYEYLLREESGRLRDEKGREPTIPNGYPAGGDFRTLFRWHLDFGTRPCGSLSQYGARWTPESFAAECGQDTVEDPAKK